MFNSSEKRLPSFNLAIAGLLLTFCVIILGSFTRLVDAGLGCPDWPGCYGHALWPESGEEINRANLAFPHAPVETDKTWPEMVHRYFATSLGVLIIGLVALAWRHRGPEQPLKLPILLLGLVILQGMFGMWTVTLKLWPQVVTAHLLSGFTTLALLWLLTLRLNNSYWVLRTQEFDRVKRLQPWVVGGLLVVIGQIALGGWTTSNYAAVACPDLPTCQAQWWPDMDFASGFNLFQELGPNYLGGMMTNESRVAIHMAHRLGAIVTFCYVLWLCFLLIGTRVANSPMLAKLTGIVLFVQILLGLSNIWFHFPVSVAVAHNAVGAVLVLCLITVAHRVFTAQRVTNDG
ncbi:MAG: cytochrome c oxidase assembly protein subunit 15 [Halieaceae bacterium]|jgi:cytochrome c oxidase assembly protein subunit 15